jgi:hypothetical protein
VIVIDEPVAGLYGTGVVVAVMLYEVGGVPSIVTVEPTGKPEMEPVVESYVSVVVVFGSV